MSFPVKQAFHFRHVFTGVYSRWLKRIGSVENSFTFIVSFTSHFSLIAVPVPYVPLQIVKVISDKITATPFQWPSRHVSSLR